MPYERPVRTPAPGFKSHSLPRLDISCYRADAAVFWTFTTVKRATVCVNEIFHLKFRELVLHTAVRQSLLCPIYTLMPDHLHLTFIGLQPESDQRDGIAFLRTHLEPLIAPAKFQHQPHDRVLTPSERTRNAFAQSCQYTLLNAARAHLVKEASEWPFMGCVIPGYANVTPFDEEYWSWFWKIFSKKRNPACDSHVRVRALYSRPNRGRTTADADGGGSEVKKGE